MSKVLWHTMTIKVPSEMVEITKTGKVSIKKTLTKMNNISKSQGYQSIKIVSSSDNKPHIITDGKEWNINQLKTNLKKVNELATKNKGRKLSTHTSLNKFKATVKEHASYLVRKNKPYEPIKVRSSRRGMIQNSNKTKEEKEIGKQLNKKQQQNIKSMEESIKQYDKEDFFNMMIKLADKYNDEQLKEIANNYVSKLINPNKLARMLYEFSIPMEKIINIT
jgi:hypothetical protein